MEVDEKMYTTLFNGITDAVKKLEDLAVQLKELQEKAEDIYISKGEE